MLTPELRGDGQRTEERKTSPVRRKIGPCQRTVYLRNQRRSRISVPPRENVFSIRPERFWIRCADKMCRKRRGRSCVLRANRALASGATPNRVEGGLKRQAN
jgi:hypothetical protein